MKKRLLQKIQLWWKLIWKKQGAFEYVKIYIPFRLIHHLEVKKKYSEEA